MPKNLFSRGRAYFLTGFAVLLPALITLALVKWIFISIASITEWLLFFLPRTLTHAEGGRGAMHWYWSLVALGLAAGLVALVGWLTRYYVGKRLVAWLDLVMLRLPLLNKIYSIIKQVNEAFSSSKKNAFKTVVLIEYPRRGIYSLGFITSDQGSEAQFHTGQPVVCIFVPTTPNPTSGFLVMVPEDQVTKLSMSVAEAIRYIISLGSVMPEFVAPPDAVAPPGRPSLPLPTPPGGSRA